MFGRIVGRSAPPTRLSSDNDPLFAFHRWKANLRILEIAEIKTVPYVPLSHPFIERLIGTIRREFLDQVPFWGAPGTCRESCSRFSDITIGHVLTSPVAAEHPTRQWPTRHGTPQVWTTTNGTHTVAACFNYQ
jgi:hypothetical protein